MHFCEKVSIYEEKSITLNKTKMQNLKLTQTFLSVDLTQKYSTHKMYNGTKSWWWNHCIKPVNMSLYIFRILGNKWNFDECNSRIDIKSASNEPMFITRHIFIIANISFSAWITCYKAKNVKHLHNLLYFHQQHRGGNDESH